MTWLSCCNTEINIFNMSFWEGSSVKVSISTFNLCFHHVSLHNDVYSATIE